MRSADDHGPGQRKGLHEGEVDVARARRQVYEQVVQLAPVGFANELLERIAGHGPAPEHGLVRVDEESNRQHFHAVVLDGDNQLLVAHLLQRGPGGLHIKHFRLRGAEDVGV